MTARFPRTQWKCCFARAYRVVLAETGHLGQTFCLVATWLGLAPFCTMAFADSRIDKYLGIDGVSEGVIYVAGVGKSSALGRGETRIYARSFRWGETAKPSGPGQSGAVRSKKHFAKASLRGRRSLRNASSPARSTAVFFLMPLCERFAKSVGDNLGSCRICFEAIA